MSTSTPPGVTVLVTDRAGRSVGTGSDFEPAAPGGYTLREAQERRARDAAWWQAFDRTCRQEVATAINQGGLTFADLRHKLTSQSGWQEHVIAHGHGEGE